jgi:hypothetical protein
MADRQQILKLRESGMTYREIAAKVGCTLMNVCYHCNENVRTKMLSKKAKLRFEVVQFLGGKCEECGCDVAEILEINHVLGGGCVERRQLSPPVIYANILKSKNCDGKYNLLCRPCNAVHSCRLSGFHGHAVIWNSGTSGGTCTPIALTSRAPDL